jgi:flagellar assembly factor FliW
MKNNSVKNLPIESLRNKVIQFPDGLPGFPTCREFIMAQEPEERPFAWMQSVSDPDLVFAVVDAYAWVKDFMLEVDDEALREMGSLDPRDYAVYFIIRIQEQDSRTTLKAKPNAPLLVNIRNRQARQIIVPLNSSLEKAEALCLQL